MNTLKKQTLVSKSADAIVVVENELRKETAEVSQNSEGQNIKMFQMKQGCNLLALL